MARTNNLTNFLTDVASAIKAKLGTETPIPASQFDTKIGEIETGGTYQAKSITIQSNGSQTVTPDSGYDALSSVAITVQVPVKQLQSKAYEFTDNTHIVLSPETGYDGFSSVELTINVPQEGGSGDIKLFETEQAMQADPSPQEGDLAVVYREELTGVTEESEFDSCTFPNTVVLNEAFTGGIYGGFGATEQGAVFAATVEVSSSRFIFSDYVESEIIAQYTSQDGITYTRTDGGEELVEFGTTIKWESFFGPFNSIIGNFMKIGGMVFEGLYEYKTNQYVIADSQLTLSSNSQLLPGITGYGKNGITVGNFGTNVSTAFNDDVAKIYAKAQIVYNDMTPLVASNNNKRAGLSSDIVLVPCKSDGTPLLDTSNVTNMYNMFAWCSNLTLIPLLDTNKVTDMSQMFYECTSLRVIPVLNTSNVTNMMGTFIKCTSMTYIPMLDTSNVTNMTSTFANCTSLTSIPLLNTSNVTTMYNCFLRLYKFSIYTIIRHK